MSNLKVFYPLNCCGENQAKRFLSKRFKKEPEYVLQAYRSLEQIESRGDLKDPYIKKLGGNDSRVKGMYEIKAGKIRVFFFLSNPNLVVVIYACYKRTDGIKDHDKDRIKAYRRDAKNELKRAKKNAELWRRVTG